MDNVKRLAAYAGVTEADILNLIKAGQENAKLSGAQLRRKRHKRNRAALGHQRARKTPPPATAEPPQDQPTVVEVYGQRWEIP
jgi:hypothetical protein